MAEGTISTMHGDKTKRKGEMGGRKGGGKNMLETVTPHVPTGACEEGDLKKRVCKKKIHRKRLTTRLRLFIREQKVAGQKYIEKAGATS